MDVEVTNAKGESDGTALTEQRIELFDWLGNRGNQHPNISLLAGAWLTWRERAHTRSGRSEPLPSLRDVDPLDMVPALPWIWLWALDDTGRLRLRLVGEEAKRAIGNWDRGSLLEDVVPPAIQPKVAERYGKVLKGPSLMTVGGEIVFHSGVRMPALRLVLPLGHAGGDDLHPAGGLIGVTSYSGTLSGVRETGGLSADAQEERFLAVVDLR